VPSIVKFESALPTAVGDNVVTVDGRSLGTEIQKCYDFFIN
jgi:hypothetical protein